MSKRPDGFIGYFDEAPHHRSSTRLMAMMMLIASIGFGGWGMAIPESRQVAMQLVVAFLTGNVSSKGISKYAETSKDQEQQ